MGLAGARCSSLPSESIFFVVSSVIITFDLFFTAALFWNDSFDSFKSLLGGVIAEIAEIGRPKDQRVAAE